MQKIYFIRAEWDDEAAVWVATSDDVPGLVTEAETMELLSAKLESLVPELLSENGFEITGEISYEVLARKFSVTHAVPAV
jgi:predicted RNase H-like HicB family nuclease